MMKFFFIILTSLTLSFPAYSLTLSEVLSKIQAKEKSLKTVEFNFEQKINYINTDVTSQVKGLAQFKKPKAMRITRMDPDKQITITNGKKMWVYNPAFNQVWLGSWQSWLTAAAMPKGIVPINNYVKELKKNFNLTLQKDDNKSHNRVRIKAVPKDDRAGYHLELEISKEFWFPVRTKYISGSAMIDTLLSDVKENPPLKEKIFSFTPIDGTEVISLN